MIDYGSLAVFIGCIGRTAAEEKYDQPQELFNETGVPIEPFNLNREREEGNFDATGGYVPNNLPQVKDAWLAGIDGKPPNQQQDQASQQLHIIDT